MTNPDETRISKSHFDLLADHGTRIALVASVNLTERTIGGVTEFHRYEDTYVKQDTYYDGETDRVDQYQHLIDHYGGDASVVQETFRERIRSQKHSDIEVRITWDLLTGTPDVMNADDLSDTLDEVVGPERLEPDFDVPGDEPVATLDIGSEAHHILKEANDYHVGANIDIKRHRGTTYLIGITDDIASNISNAIHDLQMDYRDNGSYDAARIADRIESKVFDAAPVET